jgi:hypothetical protein
MHFLNGPMKCLCVFLTRVSMVHCIMKFLAAQARCILWRVHSIRFFSIEYLQAFITLILITFGLKLKSSGKANQFHSMVSVTQKQRFLDILSLLWMKLLKLRTCVFLTKSQSL